VQDEHDYLAPADAADRPAVGPRIMTLEEQRELVTRVANQREALSWIVGFCRSLEEHHTGFRHIRRRALAAMEEG
jgi:hypothetical protein